MKVQLCIPDSMKKDAEIRAAKMGLNFSAFIRLAIAEKLGLDKEYKSVGRPPKGKNMDKIISRANGMTLYEAADGTKYWD